MAKTKTVKNVNNTKAIDGVIPDVVTAFLYLGVNRNIRIQIINADIKIFALSDEGQEALLYDGPIYGN